MGLAPVWTRRTHITSCSRSSEDCAVGSAPVSVEADCTPQDRLIPSVLSRFPLALASFVKRPGCRARSCRRMLTAAIYVSCTAL